MAVAQDILQSRPRVILSVVLTTMLGMQLLRGLLPYPQGLLIERLGWSTINAGLFALAVFLCAFLAWPLNRFFGSGLMILVTGFTIGLSRLAAQLWAGDPLGNMIFVVTGVVAFILFLPTAVGFAAGANQRSGAILATGILAGIALDLALNGAFYTYDLIWQRRLVVTAVVVLLVLAQWWSVFRLVGQDLSASAADVRFGQALSWTTIGPLLFLQLLIFANIAWAATSTGWSFAAAFFWLLFAHALGLGLWLAPHGAARLLLALAWMLALGSQILLLMGQTEVWITAVYLLSGQAALSGTLIAVLKHLGGAGDRDSLRNISVTGGIGMILLVVLLFAYYAAYDLPLPFPNAILPLAALILVAIFGFAALRDSWLADSGLERNTIRAVTAVLLVTLLIPLVLGFVEDSPQSTKNEDDPLRVMTYNIHYGTNIRGRIDLEALAQVIEAAQPDVVGLQEVSRGWLVNGSADMLVWLAHRLDMDLIFGPASDAQWGNAVLTKLPVLERSLRPLPTEDLLLKRSFIHARLLGRDGTEFNFINTHFHNPADGGAIRVLQSETILDYAGDLPQTIITGDFNAEHGMAEIDMLVEGGFNDRLELLDVEPGYTNPVPNPSRRIDYVFVTDDWEPVSAMVPYTEASDHLPIVVSITAGE